MCSPTASTEFFGEPISTYTRAQAIADGVLIDVTATAKEAGFSVPVALTRAAWEDYVAWTKEDSDRQTYQDESGRLWDVLSMARLRISLAGNNATSSLLYRFLSVPRGGKARQPRKVIAKIVSHGGDNGEHVITIMLPHED